MEVRLQDSAEREGGLGLDFAYAGGAKFLRWRADIASGHATFDADFGGGRTHLGAGVSLLVGFDAAAGSFFLEDHLFNRIVVPYPVSVSDRICVGVCQTATERRLFVGKMGGDVQSASSPLQPTAGYTVLKLY